MNTALQILFHHNLFRMLFFTLCKIFPSDLPGGEVRECLKRVFTHMQDGTPCPDSVLRDFKNALGPCSPIFTNCDQQDAHESLVFIMDALAIDEIPRGTVDNTIENAFRTGEISKEELALLLLSGIYKNDQYTLTHKYGNNNKISKIINLLYNFGCTTCTTLTAPACGHSTKIYEPAPHITLSFISSLGESIECYQCSELLQGDNRWWCDECGVARDIHRMSALEYLGPCLNFHIKRFAQEEGGGKKISDPFDFPQEITIRGKKYCLGAFGCHSGTLSGGHYISYVCRGGQWYEISDNAVKKVIYGDVIRSDKVTIITYVLVP
jgi:ubiquitin C-terminal hydrolase